MTSNDAVISLAEDVLVVDALSRFVSGRHGCRRKLEQARGQRDLHVSTFFLWPFFLVDIVDHP